MSKQDEALYFEYLSLLANKERGTKGLEKRISEIESELGMTRPQILKKAASGVMERYNK